MGERTGFYAGTFDPVTLGHIDIVRRCFSVVDQVVIGLGVHAEKQPLFSADERQALLEAAVAESLPGQVSAVRFTRFDGLVVAAAKAAGASVMIRGVRGGADFEYERQMVDLNSTLEPDIETLLLVARPEVQSISSGYVRQIAAVGGDVSAFVPKAVREALANKFG